MAELADLPIRSLARSEGTGGATDYKRCLQTSVAGQREARVDPRSGDITGRFTAPPELEVGEIAVSREQRE